MNFDFIIFNNKRLFFNSSVKPTKNIVRRQFFSWIFVFVSKLYVIDFFCGSCVFGFEFYNYGSRKVLNFDIEKSNIYNVSISLNKLNISIDDNFLLFNVDSLIWLKRNSVLNFSLLVLDPPYSFDKIIEFLLKLNSIFFLRGCLILFFETNLIFSLNYFSYDFFLIKKRYIGNVLFFLFKKF